MNHNRFFRLKFFPDRLLEPIREDVIQEQWIVLVNRLSMMRIMARRMKATVVLA